MRSMTGFGRASGEVYGKRCVVEVRSVNHRFLDLKFRLAPGWMDPVIEQLVGQFVRRRIDRGSVVVTIRDEGLSQAEPVVRVDAELGHAYGKALRTLMQLLGLSHGEDGPVPPEAHGSLLALVAAQPGVLLTGEAVDDVELRFQQLEPLLEQSLTALLDSRAREGESLMQDLLRRLAGLGDLLREVAQLTEGAPDQHKRRLEERLARLLDSGTPIDPGRLAQEVAVLADRLDVSEEVTRLRTHIIEFQRLCQREALAGRRLDFLMQEMGREVNTIGSKSQSAEVAARVISMKAELERLREQIQNVE